MKPLKLVSLIAVFLFITVGIAAAQTVEVYTTPQVYVAKRHTLAVRYPVEKTTSVAIIGTALNPRIEGKAEVKNENGRSRVKLEVRNLRYPQELGAYYTTYILWAIAPEGQAEKLAEIPIESKSEFDATTSFQTFGLIITAEPHGAVKLPSPVIVAENVLRDKTKGGIESSQIEYRGDDGSLYTVAAPSASAIDADYRTPLPILGARHAVEIARRAGAAKYADAELRQAEVKLEVLEQIWREHPKQDERYLGTARDVMRLAEQARTLTVERMGQAQLAAERRAASNTIAQAQSEAERAREIALANREARERAEREAAEARRRAEAAQTEAERAKANEDLARAEAARAKANEEAARIDAEQSKAGEASARTEAEQARMQAEQAQREKAELQQKLYVSLSAILDTRREARGLIVSLSDVLFDFNKASLKPGARERLAKLAGVLLAYPGSYQMEIEGHTDSVGSDNYNQKLSEDRAASVRAYLLESGIVADKITAVRGFGKAQPVATNDTPEGRQQNRRVEIVIVGLDK